MKIRKEVKYEKVKMSKAQIELKNLLYFAGLDSRANVPSRHGTRTFFYIK